MVSQEGAPHPARGARADGIPSLLPRDQEVWGPAGERGGAPGAGKPHGGSGGTAPALGPRGFPPLPQAAGAAVRLRAGAGAQAEHLRAQHEVQADGGMPTPQGCSSSPAGFTAAAVGDSIGAGWCHPCRGGRFVHSRNRAALSYTLALNHLADRTPQELAALRGRRRSGAPNNGQPFPTKLYTGLILPESLDWRMYGAVTPVKDQAVCGSCWSFATTGAMEGALFLKTGVLTPLSQQVLIDCSWGFGNYACDGGEEWRAYEWIKKHGGIASTESYGTYKGQVRVAVSLPGSPSSQDVCNITAVKAAIYKHGPVAVSIDASHKTFSFYSNGIYYEPKCELDHAVLAVGYGVLQGETYWLIKNSWSTYWGNDGYILMAMKDNNCGVATEATYPILA
uniref:Peptidase C1A papain C-terminal domain-containing protein n=1 Tax=Falco tinnunculus TaxID=100819 RepID=A0A8C4V506_FALTI